MDPNFPDAVGRDEEREEQMDPTCPDVAARDEEREMRMLQIIAGRTAAPVGEEDGVIGEDYSSQFLNDSGEGVPEKENGGEGEVPLTNSGEVY